MDLNCFFLHMYLSVVHDLQSSQPTKDYKGNKSIAINVTVPSGISNNSDYGNKTTEDTVWRNGGNTTPQSA